MVELPRITRALRAHTQLEKQRQLTPTNPNKLHLPKNKLERFKSYSDICEYVKTNERNGQELLGILMELKESCKQLAKDQTDDILEDATVIVLRLFLDRKLLLYDNVQLRLLFGDVTPAITNNLWEIVNKITQKASVEAKEFMKKETVEPEKEKPQLWGDSMEIHIETFKPDKKPLARMTKKPAAFTSKFVSEFSMKYEKKEEKKPKDKIKKTQPAPKESEFNKSWLEKQMRKLFPADDGYECRQYLELVLKFLHSSQSNEEMQNELFDTLGFDKIEFIQDLLVHREELVWSLNNQTQTTVESKSVSYAPRAERMPDYLCQVSVMTESEKRLQKLEKKEKKKCRVPKRGHLLVEEEDVEEWTPEQLKLKMKLRSMFSELKPPASQKPTNEYSLASWTEPIVNRQSYYNEGRYPNVYDVLLDARNRPGYVSGVKFYLPDNAIRNDYKEYEEIILPKNDPPPLEVGNKRVQITELDEIGQMAFENIKELNRIQSVVFQTAYNTNENLLICAPTGAGKTNIALLSVVHQIKKHIENGIIMKNKFKIIYIAPMKALASEMTASFSKRLQGLGIVVRELTGDMKLTKWEIQQTQMIVTTPEKWDIVTRKGATDTELAAIVKLLIIDEVHLLHGDRGPIVEAIVARTLRQVESTQNMIRIVGLSATLPNYIDVSRFLRVNPNIGLFFFDHRFRPVPLEQQFIGVKETGSGGGAHMRLMNAMNEVCYHRAAKMVKHGHQVMIFVHARNATHTTAMVMREMAQSKDHLRYFMPEDSVELMRAKKAIGSSPNKVLADLFSCGFACHHAGMLRRDRNMVEKYFSEGFIRVLVCTSTLAWGVNLPAHGVIIKGTELYDESKGQFIDLSILDVLQIFGRAGRPQFDTSGTGIIITTHNKLRHYITSITNQFPIESSFCNNLADNLNAEIALGTVTNTDEAVEWLSYTYLYVRIKLNPHVYGVKYEDIQNEAAFNKKLRDSISEAAMELDQTRMIRYDERTGDLHSTDLGRTASHYYITCETMKIFNKMVHTNMTQAEILKMLSQVSDFQNIKVRKEELPELHQLGDQYCEWPVDSRAEDQIWKTNVLLQVYLSRGRVNASSLQSDLNYISQNIVRVVRALFEITLRKNDAYMSSMFLRMAKMVELQLWDFHSDMRQFNCFSNEVLKHIEYPMLTPEQLRDYDWRELAQLVRHPNAAKLLVKCAEEFPLLNMEANVVPITRSVLKIRLTVTPNFKWNDKYHGKAPEAFWLWVEDPEHDCLYYYEYFLITKKQVITKEPQELLITIPIQEPMTSQYYIRATSERWIGSESVLTLKLNNLILPYSYPPHTDLKCLQPIPVAALHNPAYEALYDFSHFNPMQTRLFHSLYHRDCNILLGSPTGSGKTIVAEIAMFRAFNLDPNCKVVYIAPMKALVKERIKDWAVRLEGQLGMKVVELTGDVSPDVRAIKSSRVIVTTPEKWDGISRSWQTRTYVRDVSLVIIDEIHLLGEDRGPVLEVIVSRANFIESHTSRKLRIVGMTTSMANATDLADWLNIKEHGLYNFRAVCRPVPLQIHVAGFPGRHYCPRMMTMNKPTFQAIRTHSPSKPALVFVSSRRQTRLTALDLIAYLAAESNPKQWLHMQESEMEQILSNIRDSNLKLTLAFGIGLHHAGLHEKDRSTVEELFVNQKIQVLVCTATLAWGVNLPAHLVVVKGTEYYDGKQKRYVDMPITDVLQMIGRAGRPQYDNSGVAVVLIHDQKKNFYKKFFYEPLPVESSLLEVLPDHLNAEIVAGTVRTKQDIMDYLTWTYFFRRLLNNPSYYNLENLEPENISYYLSNLVQSSVEKLADAGCVEVEEDERTVHCTWMGRIASFYYLSYKTMAHFKEKLEYTNDFNSLLRIMSQCQEYSTLPVRHNEDVLNGELAPQCRLPVDVLCLDKEDVKTFLLLQAHLSRLQLPNTDYFTDTKSVLDQTIRIIQAMIDTTAEYGALASCLSCQMLVQCIVQARWHTDSALTTLPHIESQHLYLFTQMTRDTKKPCMTLNGLKVVTMNNYELLAKYLRKEFDDKQIGDIHQIICYLPTINIRLSIRGLWLDKDQEQQKEIKQPCDRNSWTPIHADQEYNLIVDMQRRGGATNNVFCPRFPKVKNEGWFLTLGSTANGELHALKRVNPKGTSQLTFYAPSKPGRVIYTVYLMSDSYMGLDQQYDIQLEVVDPLPQEKMDQIYDTNEKTLSE